MFLSWKELKIKKTGFKVTHGLEKTKNYVKKIAFRFLSRVASLYFSYNWSQEVDVVGDLWFDTDLRSAIIPKMTHMV